MQEVQEDEMSDKNMTAFPLYVPDEDGGFCQKGMTLRDWFAGQALKSGMCPCNYHNYDATADWCYKQADAMMEAREK